MDKNGNCYSCDNEAGVDVTGVEENCGVCTNRELWEWTENYTQCSLICPSDKPLWGWSGECYACQDSNPVYAPYLGERCSQTCPERALNGQLDRYCSISCKEGTFTGSDGKCYACDIRENISVNGVSHNGCEQCPNRIKFGTGCILDCPENFIRGDDGECYSCLQTETIKISTSTTYCAEKCPNRVAGGGYNFYCSIPCQSGMFYGTDGNCYRCDDPRNIRSVFVSHDGCEERCPNRILSGESCIIKCIDGEIKGSDGKCYSCNDPSPILVPGNCSETCSNRISAGGHNQYCSLPCKQNEFVGTDGKCYSCNDETNIYIKAVSHDGCEQCPDTRNLYNNYCVPKCPGDSPLRGLDNKCYPCDTETNIPVSGMTDACYECADQRKLDGNYCVLK